MQGINKQTSKESPRGNGAEWSPQLRELLQQEEGAIVNSTRNRAMNVCNRAS